MAACCDLLRLPEALLADVAEHLDELEDRKNLRLACRRLRAAASYSVRAVCLPWAAVADSSTATPAKNADNNNPLAAFPAATELVLADASLFAPPARQRALATYLANVLPARARSRVKTLRVRANCRLQREALLSALLGGGVGGGRTGGALFPALCTLDLGPAAAAVGSPSACGHTLAALVAGAGGRAAAATATALSPRAAGRRRRRDDAAEDDKEETNAECCWQQQHQPSMLLRTLLAERAACCDECLLRALGGGGAGARGLFGGGGSNAPLTQLLSGLEALSLGDCSRVTAAGMRAALAPVAEATTATAAAAAGSFSREDAANDSSSSLRSPRRPRLPPLPCTLTAKPLASPRLPLERLSYLRLGHLRCEGPAALAPLAALPRLRTLALYLCDLRDGPAAAGGAGGLGLGVNSAIFSVFDGLAGLWAPPSSSSSSPAEHPPSQHQAAPHLAALLVLSGPSAEEGKEALTARQARALAALPSLRLLAADGGAGRGALAALAARRGAQQQAPLEHLELARVDEAELLEAAADADERAAVAAEAEAAGGAAPLSSPRFRRRPSAGVCLPTVRTLWLRHAGHLPADALAAAFPGLKRFGCRELSSRLRAPRAWVAAVGSGSDGGSETAAAAHATARVRSWLQGLEKLDVPGEAWAAFLCAAGAVAPSGAVALAHSLALPLPVLPLGAAASSCSCALFPALRELALTGGDPPRFEAGAHARATRIWCEALKKQEGGVAASASAALDAGRVVALAALRRRPVPAPPAADGAAAQEAPPEQQQQPQEEQLLMWRRRSSSSGGCPAASSSSSLLLPLRARSLSADGDDAATDGIGGGDDDPLVVDHERAVEAVAAAVAGAVAAAGSAGASGSGSASPAVAAAAENNGEPEEEEDPSRPHPLAWACPCAIHHTGGPLLPAAGGEAPLAWAAAPSHCPSLRALRVRGLGGGGGGGSGALAALRSRDSCPLESVAVRRCARLFGCEAAKLRGAEPASADGCAHPDATRCPNGGCGGGGNNDRGGACPSSSSSSSSSSSLSSSHERAARQDNAAWAAAVAAAPALAWLAARPEAGLRAAVLPPSPAA